MGFLVHLLNFVIDDLLCSKAMIREEKSSKKKVKAKLEHFRRGFETLKRITA